VGTSDDTAADSGYVDHPLMLIGVGLGVMVVLLSVVFVFHQQWKSRRLASKLTLPSTPAHEALLSRSDQTADSTRRRAHQQSATAATNDSGDRSQK